MIYNYPKNFKNTKRKVQAATKVPSPQARAWYSVGVRVTKAAKTFWHWEREPWDSLHSNVQPLKWEMGKPKISPSLRRRIISLGLSTHQFPVTQEMHSSTSHPGRVSVGVMNLTAMQILYLLSRNLCFLCLIPLLLNTTLRTSFCWKWYNFPH